jgi:hypothetical protein
MIDFDTLELKRKMVFGVSRLKKNSWNIKKESLTSICLDRAPPLTFLSNTLTLIL